MSITDIRPADCSPHLQAKIEKVMRENGLAWKEAIVYLALKVVTPPRSRSRSRKGNFTP